jgi:hypothetical protein
MSVANIVALVLGSSLISSLLTTWLGHRFQTSREERRWQLDKKFAAYLEYVGALADYEGFLVGAAQERIAPAEQGSHKAAILRYVAARSSLALIASQVALQQMMVIEKKTQAHVGSINQARENKTAMPGFVDLQGDQTAFVAAAREDLGLSKAEILAQVVGVEMTLKAE